MEYGTAKKHFLGRTGKFKIKTAYRDEWDNAIELAWRTFDKFVAPDYCDRGIQSFKEFIYDKMLRRMFDIGQYKMFLAYDSKRIVGMITLRDITQISLLFVDADYHGLGIGTSLIKHVADYLIRGDNTIKGMTVNAAPDAVSFYHKIGFKDLAGETEQDGIRFTPMQLPFYNK